MIDETDGVASYGEGIGLIESVCVCVVTDVIMERFYRLAAVRADFMGRFHQPLQCFILYEALRSFPIRARVKDSVVNTRYVALGSLNEYV